MRIATAFAFLMLCLIVPAAARSGAAAPDAAALATTIRTHAGANRFSGVVRVHRGDVLLFEEAFGEADRRWHVPVAVDTRFRIASITKLFTAVLVMQQVEAGRLDLDATIGTYLPDYAGPAKDRVTLRQLLTHTSGLANSDRIKTFEEAVANGVPPYQRPGTIAELVARHASGPLVAEPGRAFDYNNADFLVLGLILETVAGTSYGELLAETIGRPLGLRDTAMADWRAIEPAFATSYLHVGDGRFIGELPVYHENAHAAGGLVSTAGDVAAFADALYGGRLVSAASLRTMLTPAREEYAFGQWVAPAKVHGRADRVAHRPGRIMGANAQLLRYVDDGLTIVILANTDAADLDAFAFLIGNALASGVRR